MLLPIVIGSSTPVKLTKKNYFSLFLSHSFFPKHIGSAHVSGTGLGDKDTMEKKRDVVSVFMEYSF